MIENGGIWWIVATFAGFLVWWPIGIAFLAAITITAISQQLTGYGQQRLNEPKSMGQAYVESLAIERAIEREVQRQIQIKQRAMIEYEAPRQITYRPSKNAVDQ